MYSSDMKSLIDELREVPDTGFAGLAWRAKVHIESLESQIEVLKSANSTLLTAIYAYEDTNNLKQENGE
jgi:hypothetical protein